MEIILSIDMIKIKIFIIIFLIFLLLEVILLLNYFSNAISIELTMKVSYLLIIHSYFYRNIVQYNSIQFFFKY